ncbi:UPF0721 transmembrane protein [Terrihabitans soli]|uniref:Probable membrane transporter protein n=1 Tax=Terrihabitans soli TaxID=708113 RepID=A0A6S6QN00_9HYPH|nr:sulfite exporter TauE/SafE family protein [Terrihabitans soli]BCJ90329.1 UPF0721 transmembrane protein [Terrihabitans soli]
MFEAVAAILSGVIVGTITAALGGGGSILCVPLLIYFVGIGDTHLAIGTSAAAITAILLLSFFARARAGHVRWDLAKWFGGFGLAGVCAGAIAAQQVPGDQLLILLGGLMLYIGVRSIIPRSCETHHAAGKTSHPKLALCGTAVGLVSGFFGISAGFLIVPALRRVARIAMSSAIGTSLAVASVFALATSVTYTLHGSVDFRLAAATTAGGGLGAAFGIFLDRHLASKPRTLEVLFGVSVFIAGAVICLKQISRLIG